MSSHSTAPPPGGKGSLPPDPDLTNIDIGDNSTGELPTKENEEKISIKFCIKGKYYLPQEIKNDKTTIGRGAENVDIVVPQGLLSSKEYAMISRIHCTLIKAPSTLDLPSPYLHWLVVDGDNQGRRSANKISVDGRQVLAAPVRSGSIVQIAIPEIFFEILVEGGRSHILSSSDNQNAQSQADTTPEDEPVPGFEFPV